ERDEGFDPDRDNRRFAADPRRFDGASSRSRPESFVDAYRRDEARGHFAGTSQRRFDPPRERGADFQSARTERHGHSPRFDSRARGFADQAIYRNREYAHHLAGLDDGRHRGEGWGRWSGDASTHPASTHPSPYTPYVGPRVDHGG